MVKQGALEDMGQPKKPGVRRRVVECVRSDQAFPFAVTLAYFAGALFVLLHHEIWRDEFSPWMIGRASRSLSELIWNIRYEGHAPGWYFIVYAITRVTRIPEAMQIVHLMLATSSVFLLARFSPIPKAWRLLYAFGFYPFYQYAVVSRGYALCILLLFSFCALYRFRQSRLVLLAVTICMLAIADTYGWFMSVALTATLAFARTYDRKHGLVWTNGPIKNALSALIIFSGIIWSAAVTIPPPDCGYHTVWHTYLSWHRFLHVVYCLNFSYNFLSQSVYLPFNIAAFAITILWFARRRVALFMFAAFVFAIACFYYLKFNIVVFWHKGVLFEYVMACIWVSYSYQDEPLKSRLAERMTLTAKRLSPALMWAILLFFVVYGTKWELNDIRKPYTSGKLVARYIKANFPPDMVIAGDSDFAATSIVGYMDKPFYYPAGDRFGTYLLYDNKRHWPITADELYAGVHRVSVREGKDILLALSYELPQPCVKRLNATLIRQFTGSVMVDENFWLYRVRSPRGLRRTARPPDTRHEAEGLERPSG